MSVTIPDLHPPLRALVELGAKRKWMSYEELNTCLPDEMVDPEKLDELLVLVDRLAVDFVDENTVRRKGYDTFQAPLQTNLKFKRDDPKRLEKRSKISIDPDCEEDETPHPVEGGGRRRPRTSSMTPKRRP